MRIVHFSDIHVGAWVQSVQALFDKRLLGLLNYIIRRRPHMNEQYIREAVQRIPELQPDCVICSGDVTCIGSPVEFTKARQLLRPLTSAADFDFLYVPGNHDAYVQARDSRQALLDTFRELNNDRWDLERLPVRHKVDRVEFMLINECHPTPIWGSYGSLHNQAHESLRSWVSEDLPEDQVRCLIGHFPTRRENGVRLARRRELRGGEYIRDWLADGRLDLSLCGHIHDPYINCFDSGSLEICTGSLTTHGCMNIIDIDEQGRITQNWCALSTAVATRQETGVER